MRDIFRERAIQREKEKRLERAIYREKREREREDERERERERYIGGK